MKNKAPKIEAASVPGARAKGAWARKVRARATEFIARFFFPKPKKLKVAWAYQNRYGILLTISRFIFPQFNQAKSFQAKKKKINIFHQIFTKNQPEKRGKILQLHLGFSY